MFTRGEPSTTPSAVAARHKRAGLAATPVRGRIAPIPTNPDGSRPQQPLPFTAVRTMTASARRVNLDDPAAIELLARARTGNEWQSEAWEYYDAIGEIKYAFTLVANVMSRVRLYPARVDDPAEAPTALDNETDDDTEQKVVAALARLASSFGGQPGMLRDAALNLCVTGECNLVQTPAAAFPVTEESWDIRSVDELTVTNGRVTVKTSRDARQQDIQVLPKNAFIARIWRQHPRFSNEADSSLRGMLDLCAELLLLNRTFRATARSRLNSGMLYLPDGLSVAASPDPEDVDMLGDESVDSAVLAGATASVTADEDEFEEALIEAMTAPINDEDSAAAVVPLIIRGPAELADKIKIFKFERVFDPALATRSDRVLERIMQGLDVPKDIVTGLANVKYANALQIDESLYKAHIEPLALLICDALTYVYMRPLLKAQGVDEETIKKYVIWYDPSEVTTRPNRAEDADAGYDRYIVSEAAWRRSHGFSDEDEPSSEELATRLVVERGSITPELTEAVLQVIAPGIMKQVREASQEAAAEGGTAVPSEIMDAIGGTPATPSEPPEPIPSGTDPFAPPVPTSGPAPSTTPTPNDTVSPQELLQ
jgi:hypothetical protein